MPITCGAAAVEGSEYAVWRSTGSRPVGDVVTAGVPFWSTTTRAWQRASPGAAGPGHTGAWLAPAARPSPPDATEREESFPAPQAARATTAAQHTTFFMVASEAAFGAGCAAGPSTIFPSRAVGESIRPS